MSFIDDSIFFDDSISADVAALSTFRWSKETAHASRQNHAFLKHKNAEVHQMHQRPLMFPCPNALKNYLFCNIHQ